MSWPGLSVYVVTCMQQHHVLGAKRGCACSSALIRSGSTSTVQGPAVGQAFVSKGITIENQCNACRASLLLRHDVWKLLSAMQPDHLKRA